MYIVANKSSDQARETTNCPSNFTYIKLGEAPDEPYDDDDDQRVVENEEPNAICLDDKPNVEDRCSGAIRGRRWSCQKPYPRRSRTHCPACANGYICIGKKGVIHLPHYFKMVQSLKESVFKEEGSAGGIHSSFGFVMGLVHHLKVVVTKSLLLNIISNKRF